MYDAGIEYSYSYIVTTYHNLKCVNSEPVFLIAQHTFCSRKSQTRSIECPGNITKNQCMECCPFAATHSCGNYHLEGAVFHTDAKEMFTSETMKSISMYNICTYRENINPCLSE